MTVITREEIENIALLSKLSVEESEYDNLISQMQKIIDFAHTIDDADDFCSDFDNINNLTNAFREDVVRESFDKEEILKNASDVDKDHFLVRKRA